MSGHSKWSTIKHKKAATDAKRGKAFTRIAKEMTIAARDGGGDPATNNRLALIVSKAKAANMTKDSIERAIKRGTGELEGGELSELTYEVYAPNGIGLVIEVVTDNKRRSIADLRHVVNKNGGTVAASGAVAWQFTRKGYITVDGEVDEDELFMVAAEAGADDVQFGDIAEIFVEIDSFQAVQTALTDANIKFQEAALVFEPNSPSELNVADSLQVMKFVDKVEDVDDVQNVYSTLDISDEAIAAMDS